MGACSSVNNSDLSRKAQRMSKSSVPVPCHKDVSIDSTVSRNRPDSTAKPSECQNNMSDPRRSILKSTAETEMKEKEDLMKVVESDVTNEKADSTVITELSDVVDLGLIEGVTSSNDSQKFVNDPDCARRDISNLKDESVLEPERPESLERDASRHVGRSWRDKDSWWLPGKAKALAAAKVRHSSSMYSHTSQYSAISALSSEAPSELEEILLPGTEGNDSFTSTLSGGRTVGTLSPIESLVETILSEAETITGTILSEETDYTGTTTNPPTVLDLESVRQF